MHSIYLLHGAPCNHNSHIPVQYLTVQHSLGELWSPEFGHPVHCITRQLSFTSCSILHTHPTTMKVCTNNKKYKPRVFWIVLVHAQSLQNTFSTPQTPLCHLRNTWVNWEVKHFLSEDTKHCGIKFMHQCTIIHATVSQIYTKGKALKK